jgi:hypothetical protein
MNIFRIHYSILPLPPIIILAGAPLRMPIFMPLVGARVGGRVGAALQQVEAAAAGFIVSLQVTG